MFWQQMQGTDSSLAVVLCGPKKSNFPCKDCVFPARKVAFDLREHFLWLLLFQ